MAAGQDQTAGEREDLTMGDDVALRRWAIEQSIALHGPSGMTVDKIISEAKTLLAWVQPQPSIEVIIPKAEQT
jgi:hypothetical protein